MSDEKNDLFSVRRRSFPCWETVCLIQDKLSGKSLLNHSDAQLPAVAEGRLLRLEELIEEENRSGIVYFCERKWLESFPAHQVTYSTWVANEMNLLPKTETTSTKSGIKRIKISLGNVVLPPLLTDQARSWIELSNYYPNCTICFDQSAKLNNDWFVQAAHLIHNCNYYLEILNAGATEEIRGEEVCFFDYIHLDTRSNNSQIWILAVNPGGGEYGIAFLREEPLVPNIWKDNPNKDPSGPCWYPGCAHDIPEPDLDYLIQK